MKKDKSCKKNHESTIGKIIYGFLLFMPLLAIFVTCGYAMFNKNAKDSYYGENINQSEINFVNTFEVGDRYYLSLPSNDLTIHNTNGDINRTIITIDDIQVIQNTSNYDLTNAKKIGFWSASNSLNFNIKLYDENNNAIFELANNTSYGIEFSFELKTITQLFLDFFNGNDNIFYQVHYNNVSFVSEVFYYSVDRVTQSNLFNWAQNSIIYTGINNFSTSMSITTPFIPLLLTYWLIISLVYFLYDIILVIFIVMHRKIHELEESI